MDDTARRAWTARIVAGALILSSTLFVALGALVPYLQGQRELRLLPLAYVAAAVAVFSPGVAFAARSVLSGSAGHTTRGLEQDPAVGQRQLTATIVSFAVLESAVLFCAVALFVTHALWLLVAAAVPLGAMLASFPRSG